MVHKFFAKTAPFTRLLKQNVNPFLDQTSLKTAHVGAAHTHMINRGEYLPGSKQLLDCGVQPTKVYN